MDKLKKYGQLSIPILLGVCAFIFVTEGKILWPRNINWLFLHGDMSIALLAGNTLDIHLFFKIRWERTFLMVWE